MEGTGVKLSLVRVSIGVGLGLRLGLVKLGLVQKPEIVCYGMTGISPPTHTFYFLKQVMESMQVNAKLQNSNKESLETDDQP